MCAVVTPELQSYRHRSVNACLAPLCSVHGLAVTTVEGIGSTRTKLHAVQVMCYDLRPSGCIGL